jgi:hypothetical protein
MFCLRWKRQKLPEEKGQRGKKLLKNLKKGLDKRKKLC